MPDADRSTIGCEGSRDEVSRFQFKTSGTLSRVQRLHGLRDPAAGLQQNTRVPRFVSLCSFKIKGAARHPFEILNLHSLTLKL